MIEQDKKDRYVALVQVGERPTVYALGPTKKGAKARAVKCIREWYRAISLEPYKDKGLPEDLEKANEIMQAKYDAEEAREIKSVEVLTVEDALKRYPGELREATQSLSSLWLDGVAKQHADLFPEE